MDGEQIEQLLKNIYQRLMAVYGRQHWWPAEEPFEVMIGAILTQSAAWRNAEQAIANLRAAEALSPEAIRRLPLPELAQIIRPCGYYNAKALKLKSLADWLGNNYQDDLNRLSAGDVEDLRRQLLSIHGIGQETADSILLYAAGKPIFVIDAYTRRIISRIGLAPDNHSYTAYQQLFMASLTADARLFNEYHALLVKLAKDACRKIPVCDKCCLNDICLYNKEMMPRLTLDTNLLQEYWKKQAKHNTVKKLLLLAEQGKVDLAVTARIHEDIPKPLLMNRIDELPELNVNETASVARLDYLILDRDILGDQAFADFFNDALALANKRVGKKRLPDWRDWDHLHAHYLLKRDVFLTWDEGIICLTQELKDKFGVVVMKPEKFLKDFSSYSL